SIGGLVGSNYGDIENCYVEGTVEGESSTGLLVGFNDGTIEKSYANGSVKGDSESTGGLVGYNFTGTIKETYSAGSVYGSKDNVGGLVGHNFAGDIIDSYSTARVEGRYNVGGLVGEMISGSITNCYAIGQVSDGRNNVGGLIGEAFDMVRIVDSYWDRIETNQASSSGGEGKLTKALLMQEFYSNWSFTDVWTIDENESYPYFKWQNKNIPEKSFDYFVEGNGTTSNPYIITNSEELNLVRYELDGHYKLGNDINLASYGQWETIGTDKTEFKGSLDGDRHKIINLTIDADSDNQGLFGVIHKTAIIKNIGLENVNVSNTDNEYTGALAGENHGLIQNTYVKGSVKGEKFTGLLVGDNDGTIETSYTDGSIVGDSHYVGGLVGYNSGNINETYSTGSVYGAKNNVGGLVGTNRDGSIENSYSTASVEGKHDVGGLVGEVTSGTINNCYSTGEVTDIDNNDGHGHDGHWFGENKIGGLIGSKHFMATVRDSYWNIDTSGQRDSDGGIGKTTTEMKSEETYRNWNFQDVWSIDSRGKINNGYPCIQQIMPPTITLNGETETTLEVFSRYIEEGAVVTDIVEGNLTNNLKIIGSVDTSMLGDYKITYKVSDNMGNEVTEYRTIHVVDTTKPIITLIGDETVHLNVGDNYIEEGSIAEDNYDGNITDNIEISGAVDTNIEGTYEIKYNVTDDNGNIANEVIRTIVVTLGIPDNLMTSATSDSINISWLPVTGATGYDIEVYGSIVDAGDKTEYTHEGLNPNTQLTYRVRAKSSRSVSKWSGIVAQTTLTGTPKNIDAEATDTTIDLSWDPVSGAKAYDIEIDGVVSEIIDNKYLHDQLLSSSEHSYRIRSKNEEGISEWSELFIKSTLPSIPSNLSSDIQINEVTLTWDEVPRVTGYEVEINGEVIENGMSNTYTIDTNEPNKEYIFRVRSNNEGLNSGWSSQIVVITPPEEPKNLIATSLSTQITVKWDSVIGAEGYEIEIDGEVYDVGLKTTYMHSNLTPNTEYSYRIRSKNNGGISEWSEKIVATTLLSVPSNLGAVSSSDGIFLTWDDVDGAVGYDVLVDGETIDNGNSTVFEHKDLEPNTWHYYRVRAKQGEYVGDWSDSITQATLVGIPTNIHTSSSSSKIIVKWDTVNGAEGYDLLVDGELVEDVDSSKYRHDELDPGTTHSYKIRAKNSNGISDWSILVKQITSPDIPDDLEAEATTSEIRIVWDEVDGASSYDIEVDGKVIEELDTTEYIHKDLEPNTWHLYRVRARNNGGYSEWSEELQYNTKPEISVNVGKDTTFNFVVVAPKKDGVTTRYIEVNYNPDELEVIDLCAVTPEVNLESGDITGTNISVTSFEPGRITYKVTDADKTIVNSIKFKAKVSKHSKVTYEVK
ncbi:fibronectin type III domain-containing protein, partial [Sporosalibacterium faouarense]|uniref:fibronectin type III domain-containing protein n=1 Tax=Sporosalibacterium faouarense TaxID=516123 RepID=UPI00192B80B6